jgi:hypothetical protein
VAPETEVNGDSKRTHERGSFLVGSLVPVQEILFSLGCSSRSSIKYIFPRRTQFQFLCPHRLAGWTGSRAGSPVYKYLSLVVIIRPTPPPPTYTYNMHSTETVCRLQDIYHGPPYAKVDLNPMSESTLFPSQGLRVWPALELRDLSAGQILKGSYEWQISF